MLFRYILGGTSLAAIYAHHDSFPGLCDDGRPRHSDGDAGGATRAFGAASAEPADPHRPAAYRPMMNRLEREQLTQFLEQLTPPTAVAQDSEASALIRAACARQPAAQYLLVQRAMRAERAVHDAQREITRLRDQLEQTRNQSPAAERGASTIDANAWGNCAAAQPTRPSQAASQTTRATGAPAPVANAWGSGMMGTMATTAVGVVAGGLLFQGVGHLLGGASAGSTNGLNSPPAESATEAHVDGEPGVNSASTGIFDTSSVDDYIASGIDDTDSL